MSQEEVGLLFIVYDSLKLSPNSTLQERDQMAVMLIYICTPCSCKTRNNLLTDGQVHLWESQLCFHLILVILNKAVA